VADQVREQRDPDDDREHDRAEHRDADAQQRGAGQERDAGEQQRQRADIDGAPLREGADGHLELIKHIVESGVPVMGHLGLTPQSINQLGGSKVQGKKTEQAQKILDDALALEKAGCFSLVLECVPAALAKEISEKLQIPTIGIGAGHDTDGQVLVLQDMLGMNPDFSPKFLKKFMDGADLITAALNDYVSEVKDVSFPGVAHQYE